MVADGTYKLTQHGWPMLVLGCVDLQQRFRSVAVALSSDETTESYNAFFSSVKAAAHVVFEFEPNPKCGLSDHASAIGKAAKSVWPGITWGDCFSHISVSSLHSLYYACMLC